MTAQDWFMLIFAGAYLVLLNWLRLSLVGLKSSVDDELTAHKTELTKEKEQTVWRIDEIYKRVDSHKSEIHAIINRESEYVQQCRKELDDKVATLMPEAEVKDFVDRSLKPMVDDIKSTKDAVEVVRQGNDKIHTDLGIITALVGQLVNDKK